MRRLGAVACGHADRLRSARAVTPVRRLRRRGQDPARALLRLLGSWPPCRAQDPRSRRAAGHRRRGADPTERARARGRGWRASRRPLRAGPRGRRRPLRPRREQPGDGRRPARPRCRARHHHHRAHPRRGSRGGDPAGHPAGRGGHAARPGDALARARPPRRPAGGPERRHTAEPRAAPARAPGGAARLADGREPPRGEPWIAVLQGEARVPLIRLAVRAPAEAAEQVLAALLELAPAGVEQVDGEGFVEFAVYGAPGELPALPDGEADVGGVQVRVEGREVPDDWAERWKRFHVPVLVGGRLWVRPPWEEEAIRPGVIDLAVDPGQAFGTGAHPTTRMCLELLLELEPSGSFADLGCGSGVLPIAAAKLGFEPVTAVDSDRGAVEATLANARANGVVLERVERLNLREQLPPPADVVAANLMRPLLLRVGQLMSRPPRALIVSGLLEEETDEVLGAFAPLGEERRLTNRGWAAALL